jgi:hypothetical protein
MTSVSSKLKSESVNETIIIGILKQKVLNVSSDTISSQFPSNKISRCSSSDQADDYYQPNMSFDSSSAMPEVSHESSHPQCNPCVSPLSTKTSSQKRFPPPVGEICIPTPSTDSLDTVLTSKETIPEGDSNKIIDYETLYFCGQRDLHFANQRVDYMCEENRLLKRKLIELQRQLYCNSRTKRRVVDANLAWRIPGEISSPCPSNNITKYQRISPFTPPSSSEQTQSLLRHTASSLGEGKKSSKVQFASSKQPVVFTVTSAQDLTGSTTKE